MIVDGQAHGGLAQGIGQALFEEAIYDDDGQLVNGSFLNYVMPRAADLPNFKVGNHVDRMHPQPDRREGRRRGRCDRRAARGDQRRARCARAARRDRHLDAGDARKGVARDPASEGGLT